MKEETVSTSPEASSFPSPWRYIITLYLPFGIISGGLMVALPTNFFKLLEYSNQEIGLLSGIGIVATFRFLFAPWLDGCTTKRRLSLITLTLAAFASFLAAMMIWSHPTASVLWWSMVGVLSLTALVGAAHETAADGFYIRALDPSRQAQFIGIKTASIRCGIIFTTMVLLMGATRIASHYGAIGVESINKAGFYRGFAAAYLAAGVLMLLFAIWNCFAIPRIPEDQPVRHSRFALGEVFKEYLQQPKVGLIILLILLYRFGEGFLTMKYPFYLDAAKNGGLARPASNIPYISILAEMPWMITGGILGGYLIKWFGLRRTFLPLGLCINVPHFLFVWLAWARPDFPITLFGEQLNAIVLACSSIEAFFYGMSFSALFYYMHITATESGRNKTAVLAISFALMNLGWVVPGMLSGFVQAAIGYTGVFLVSSTVGLFALAIIPFLPMPKSCSFDRP
jgi:PAT family beta-lactamase induction signal transducer AmpG